MNIRAIVGYINGLVWSEAMLVLVIGSGLFFTVGLSFFQFRHHFDMWKNILGNSDSDSGISTFSSFCTTMAARIGTGNVAGVAVAIFHGGPGALFWMWIVGCTNSALAFVECTLGQLYKMKVDGEYRGSGAHCAERGLGWKGYAALMAAVLMVGAGAFMPAAATYSICDGFNNALGIPRWISSLIVTILLGIIIIGGIKRIGQFASYIVPFMTLAYLVLTLITLFLYADRIPAVFRLIFSSAFNRGAVMGGVEGGLLAAILQGVKRGTFSSAAGMGESTPAAAAAETSHPVKQGLANAAGVFLDTIVVCTATGLLILLTGCFNTSLAIGGYKSGDPVLAGKEGGVIFVQEAAKGVLGNFAPIFIAVMLFLFSFTCIMSYYYESETSAMYLFRKDNQQRTRLIVRWIIRIVMIVLTFIWGISESSFAWDVADLALGVSTWINVIMLWFLFPKVRALYMDYCNQKRLREDPYYDPNTAGLCWDGVDADLWREINRARIEKKRLSGEKTEVKSNE